MGTAILFVLIVVETLFLGWAVTTKDPRRREKAIASLALLALLLLLLASQTAQWLIPVQHHRDRLRRNRVDVLERLIS